MKIDRRYVCSGIILIIAGVTIIVLAFPWVPWISNQSDHFGITFSAPSTWSLTPGEDDVTTPVLELNAQDKYELVGTDTTVVYQVNITDTTSSALISIYAYPLPDDNSAGPEIYSMVQEASLRKSLDDYIRLYAIHMQVDGWPGFQRADLYSGECFSCPDARVIRHAVVATYVLSDRYLYHIVLKEDELLNAVRDWKIYDRLIKSIDIK